MSRWLAVFIALWTGFCCANQRIVTLSPHTTELVYALGAGEQLVGVSAHSDFPQEATRLPQIADHNGIDLEGILRLQPDLIVAWQGGNKSQDLARLESLGFTLFYSDPKQPQDIASEIVALGKLLGKSTQANKVSEQFTQQLEKIRQRAAKYPPKTVFYYLWPTPLMTIGKEAWAAKLLSHCNANNVFDDAITDYPQVALEQVIKRQPQLIVAATSSDETQTRQFWAPWQQALSARVIIADPDKLHRFTPRLTRELSRLCESIHQKK